MTTIAVRGKVMAADSQTMNDDMVYSRCEKIFRKRVTINRRKRDILIGTAGEDFSGMLFVDWYPGAVALELNGPGAIPKALEEFKDDFLCLTLEPSGVYLCDLHLRPIKLLGKFFAIGSGAKLALAAMEMGASAAKAVEIACKYCAGSRPPVVTERLG